MRTAASTGSGEAEQRLLELVRAARLPYPETHVRVGRHEVDFLSRAEALVVEVDGFAGAGPAAVATIAAGLAVQPPPLLRARSSTVSA